MYLRHGATARFPGNPEKTRESEQWATGSARASTASRPWTLCPGAPAARVLRRQTWRAEGVWVGPREGQRLWGVEAKRLHHCESNRVLRQAPAPAPADSPSVSPVCVPAVCCARILCYQVRLHSHIFSAAVVRGAKHVPRHDRPRLAEQAEARAGLPFFEPALSLPFLPLPLCSLPLPWSLQSAAACQQCVRCRHSNPPPSMQHERYRHLKASSEHLHYQLYHAKQDNKQV